MPLTIDTTGYYVITFCKYRTKIMSQYQTHRRFRVMSQNEFGGFKDDITLDIRVYYF